MEDDKILEVCFMCGETVEIENKLELQECPECGDYITPCNICPRKPEGFDKEAVDFCPCENCTLLDDRI